MKGKKNVAASRTPPAPADELEKNYDSDDTESNKTILTPDDASLETMNIQIQELRSQLEAAVANATKEKEERMRLQEEFSRRQQQIISNDAQSIDKKGAAGLSVVSTATAPIMCTSVASTQYGSSTLPCTSAATQSYPLPCTSAAAAQHPSFPFSLPMYQPPLLQTITALPQNYPLNAEQASHLVAQPTFQPTYMSPSTYAAPPSMGPNSANALHTMSYYGGGRKLQHLPDFSGKPEEWPMFCTSYHETTLMFRYTNVENNLRLQRCIKGDAKEVVEALLIHPDNVNRVMAALEFRFGRPECLLRSQLAKVREIAQIPEGKLELLIPFATKVQNLSTFLEASGLRQHLANPTLMDELISKLPMSKRLEWAQRSIYIQPYATVQHFDEWLTSVARLVCLVTSDTLSPQADCKQKPRSVLQTTAQSTPPAVDKNKCRYCQHQTQLVSECSSYTTLNTKGKWEFAKKNRLCFGCLRWGHNLRTCRYAKRCGQDCPKVHHKSLHDSQKATSSSKEEAKEEEPESSSLLNCDTKTPVSSRILFRVVPVRLYGANEKMVKTYALLDEGSSVTIMSAQLADKLQLGGDKTSLSLKWFGGSSVTEESLIVNLKISADKDDAEVYDMKGIQTIEDLSLPTQSLSAKDLHPIRRRLSDITLPSYDNVEPQILIGLDNCHLGTPLRIFEVNEFGPVAAETKLGWVVYGSTPRENLSEPVVLLSSREEEAELETLNQLVNDFFSLDSFGVKKPTEPFVSPADKRAQYILSSTTTKISGRYRTGLIWKDDDPEMPSSYDMAQRRLWSLERRFEREPEFAAAYRGIIASYLEKGYARKLSDTEAETTTKKTWYLPHFGERNSNKPGRIRLVFDAAAEVIPSEVFEKWKLWREELPKLSQCRLPRCHHVGLTTNDRIVLHIFVDASEEAFSAVAYLRIEVGGEFFVSFVCGKMKCAPKNLVSIPRLELSAAVLGVRFHDSIIEHHDLSFSDSIFWSDSKTVINWLKSDPRRHKQFVAFRITEVLESSKVDQWRWVPSKLNPADEATRAKYPPRYEADSKWLKGPSFLRWTEESWPAQPDDVERSVCKNELLTANTFVTDAIKAELSSRRIEWVFNCPSNPHAGGCWERLIRSVKRVLAYSLHELAPRLETLYSALTEAENIVNSRPLTHLPISTDEEDPLTPNDFLLGCPNSTQTPGPLDPRALCLRKQWRVSQEIKNRFWKRWMREYLPMLTRRNKWYERVPPLEVGDLVLICDDALPRSGWKRGRIERVFRGPDDQVRSADVKTAVGVLRRPVVKLAKLDVGEASEPDSASRGVGC